MMATGYGSVHPRTEELLSQLGVPSSDVSQGVGSAPASAGYHAAEGTAGGREFSSCVDLRWKSKYVNPAFKSRMVAAGFCPFYRNWAGNRHIHAVQIGLQDDNGRTTILAGPRMQIIDYTRGLNGLVGHGRLTGSLAPTTAEREALRGQYAAWADHVRTKVYKPDGGYLPCYAFLEPEESSVTVEVRAFVEGLGANILDCAPGEPGTLVLQTADGRRVEKHCRLWLAGTFMRGPVRDLARACGYKVSFEWGNAAKTWCEVRLG